MRRVLGPIVVRRSVTGLLIEDHINSVGQVENNSVLSTQVMSKMNRCQRIPLNKHQLSLYNQVSIFVPRNLSVYFLFCIVLIVNPGV